MWHGQQPPGGEQNPQDGNPYQQRPPAPPGPPGFPPYPAAAPAGTWGPPEPPRGPNNKKRAAVIATVAAVAVAAVSVTAVLVLGRDDGKDNGEDSAGGARPGNGSASAGPSGSRSAGPSTDSSHGPVVPPLHSSGPNGTSVTVGGDGARHALDVYEDLRCPPCALFERKVAARIAKGVGEGRYKAVYHFATFLDDSQGGSGSKNALSALGAALNVGTQPFLDYKKALYAEENHPEESDDAFADDGELLRIADGIPALKGNADFREDVREGTYDAWATLVDESFDAADVPGTPALEFDDESLTGPGGGAPMTAADFDAAIAERLETGTG